MTGKGRYDELATELRAKIEAETVIVVAIDGNLGDGMSVVTRDFDINAKLPGILRELAGRVEKEVSRPPIANIFAEEMEKHIGPLSLEDYTRNLKPITTTGEDGTYDREAYQARLVEISCIGPQGQPLPDHVGLTISMCGKRGIIAFNQEATDRFINVLINMRNQIWQGGKP